MVKMKPLLTILMVTCMSFASSDAMALRKEIDRYITADNGCRFHVTGWVEYGLFPPRVSDYDITLDGPCGRFRFQGLVTSDESGTTIRDAKLHNLDTAKDENVPSSPFLGSVVVQLEKEIK